MNKKQAYAIENARLRARVVGIIASKPANAPARRRVKRGKRMVLSIRFK